MRKYGGKECLGTREVLRVGDEVQHGSKGRLYLGEYRWMTYQEVDAQGCNSTGFNIISVMKISQV